ncbi:hypothetical protein BGZ82_000286 [Podila clonocystis]|nr:hypothetical protein BGZ82_000286 [Podila clonocystis]
MSGLLSFTKLAFAAPRLSFAAGNTMAARAYATKKLFVGNIAWGTTDDEAKEFFSQYGTLKDAHFPKDPQGRTKGYGFLELEEDEANKVIQETNGRELNGRELRVDAANPREPRDEPRGEFRGEFRPRRQFNNESRPPRGEFRPRRDFSEDGERTFRPRRENREGGERSFRRPRQDSDDRE